MAFLAAKSQRRMQCVESSFEQMLSFATIDSQYPGLKSALLALHRMIGMDAIKESIAEQVQYFVSMALANRRVSPPLTRASASARRSIKRSRRKKHGWSRRKKSKPSGVSVTGTTGQTSACAQNQDRSATIVRAHIQDLTSAILETMGSEDSDDSDYEGGNNGSDDPVSSCRPTFARSMNLHTLLLGSPGTGKTSLARVLVGIWSALGLIERDNFCTVTRGDLVAKYQGHSTAKIKKLMQQYQNGVIFIDEAYALIADDKDTFGNEVMAEIVEAMTNPTNNVTFIMAGYEKAVKSRLLGQNEGLERRFGAIHVVPKPSVRHLGAIYHTMLCQGRWSAPAISIADVAAVLRANPGTFIFAGGDMEVLTDLTRKAHIKRMWPAGLTRRIHLADINNAIRMFKRSKDRSRSPPIEGLYS